MNVQRILLFFSVVLLASCDCSRYTKNIVADSDSHFVLTNVQVYSVAAMNERQREEKTTYTDSIGSFEAGFSISGVSKCPTLKVRFSRFDYETKWVVSPQIGDTIFLKRIAP